MYLVTLKSDLTSGAFFYQVDADNEQQASEYALNMLLNVEPKHKGLAYVNNVYKK